MQAQKKTKQTSENLVVILRLNVDGEGGVGDVARVAEAD